MELTELTEEFVKAVDLRIRHFAGAFLSRGAHHLRLNAQDNANVAEEKANGIFKSLMTSNITPKS
jgi:hypothetical protein